MTLKVAVPASLSQAGKDYLTNKGYTLVEEDGVVLLPHPHGKLVHDPGV